MFAQAKYLKWEWPELYEEDKFIIMLGGLHVKKVLWSTLADTLDCSGWASVLKEATVAKSGTSDSYLKAAHITRTRKAHEFTTLALFILQKGL